MTIPEETQRELAQLKEILETRIQGHKELDDERFRNVDERFELVEKMRLEQKADTAVALSKSQQVSSEAITKLSDVFQTTTNALDSSIEDVKTRVGRIESTRQGALESAAERRGAISSTSATVGIIVGLLSILTVYFGLHSFRTPTTTVVPPVVTVTTTVSAK